MPEQLALNYEQITKVASRDYLRDNFTRSSREIYKIPLSSLQVREGFNKRIVYNDIEALADSIAAKGLETPLDVDVLPDGRVFIEKGHLRYKAICFNRDRGIVMEFVDCYPNPKEKTEQQRMLEIYSSNMHASKLNPVEQANTVFALKNNFGEISNEKIGASLGISRQQVDNLLIIASSDDLTKNELINGNLGITEALSYIRGLKKSVKDAELDANKNPSAAPQEPKDALANDIKEMEVLQNEESEEEMQQRLLREQTKRDQEWEQLMEISDEIKVREKTIKNHIGRKLSVAVVRQWIEDFVDEDNGEVVSIDRNEEIIPKGIVLTEDVIPDILSNKVENIFLYKKGMEPVAKSVITVDLGEREKSQFDESREEIGWCQNLIKNLDWLSVQSEKLPEQTSKDFVQRIGWIMKDAELVRDWVSKNKRENKRGR